MTSTAQRIALTALVLGACLATSLMVHSAWLGAILAAWHLHVPDTLHQLFWDSDPYARGIAKIAAGRTPYDDPLDESLPFAYPPIFARAGALLARLLPSPIGYTLYVALYCLSMVGTQLLLAPFFLRGLDRARALTLLILAPLSLVSSTMFWSGNIHVIWLFLAALAAVPGVRGDRWMAYRIVALFAMINQPLFASLLLLPVFAGRRQWLPSIATAVLGAAVYLGQRVVDPVLNTEFQRSLPARLAVLGDYGQGMFGIVLWAAGKLTGAKPLLAAGALQVAVSLAIVGGLFALRGRVARDDPRWWALLAVAIVAVNPRIMPYDVAAVATPAIALLFALPAARQWAVAAVVTLAGLAFHKALGLTPLLFAALAVGGWTLWTGRRDQSPSARPDG